MCEAVATSCASRAVPLCVLVCSEGRAANAITSKDEDEHAAEIARLAVCGHLMEGGRTCYSRLVCGRVEV